MQIVDLESMTFRQLAALLRELCGGSIGFDLYRDQRTNTVEALRAYVRAQGKTQKEMQAAWDRFVSNHPNKPSRSWRGPQPKALVQNVSKADEFLNLYEPAEQVQAEREPQHTQQTTNETHSTMNEQTQAPAGSLDAIIGQIARQAAAGAVNEAQVRRIAGELDLEWVADMEGRVAKLVASAIAQMPAREINVTRADAPTVKIEGRMHRNFELLLKLCNARKRTGERFNVWLHGPAGTGKTTAGKYVAQALTLKFFLQPAVIEPFQLLGYRGANGEIVRTPFRDAWEHGGVLLMSEADAYSEQAMLAINPALANGLCAFPDANIPRHVDCVIICDANTNGSGGTHTYNGRVKHDAAFLNRFAFLDWPLDEETERHASGNVEWHKTVAGLRAAAKRNGTDVSITPRATYDGADLLAQGFTKDEVVALVLRQGASDDAWAPLAREVR